MICRSARSRNARWVAGRVSAISTRFDRPPVAAAMTHDALRAGITIKDSLSRPDYLFDYTHL